jgi:hypothetical protein
MYLSRAFYINRLAVLVCAQHSTRTHTYTHKHTSIPVIGAAMRVVAIFSQFIRFPAHAYTLKQVQTCSRTQPITICKCDVRSSRLLSSDLICECVREPHSHKLIPKCVSHLVKAATTT